MKLYYSAGACSLAPHIVLAELNFNYETEAVNLKEKTSASGDFRKINPKGSVPALKLDNGEYLTEGVAISTYLADLKGELIPKFGTPERMRYVEWMNFIATDIHKSFTPFWITGMLTTNEEAQKEIKNFYSNVLTNKFQFVSEKLGTNDYLMGKNFTVCDAYLFTVMSWAKHINFDLSKWNNITAWMARVYARPGVQKAMKEEGLLK